MSWNAASSAMTAIRIFRPSYCANSRFVTGNLEWRFLKLLIASLGYNFRIAEKPSMGRPIVGS